MYSLVACVNVMHLWNYVPSILIIKRVAECSVLFVSELTLPGSSAVVL